ncbi:methyl-accepting chemotaxis protein [Massilia sp. AB1]|uniref:methyl-accepting chemotaxis protein n=1 Tax=Massilia sp. AB1 TaxID=2823371 RepID=UPI001B818705|nr:methyl-accepting chemotaxis protein [Massilia sp. AB1]MBQ5940099.1 MCP four helix bundle domain-containing protein [Massilia sp. AB1]
MLARLRIGPKLLLAPGAVLFLLVLLSCSAYYAMVRQNASLEEIVGQRAASMRAASSLAAQSQKTHADIYRLLSWMGGSFPIARTEPLRRDILIEHERIADGLSQLARMTGPHAAERRHVEQAISAHQAYTAAVRDVIELAPLDGSISANAMLKAESAFAVVAQRLADLAVIEETLSRQASNSAQSDFRVMSTLMPIVIVLAIGISLAITFAVRRLLLDEIRGIGAAVSGLASGDLTVRERAYGGDEIAETSRALDASIRNLNGTLRSILESARVIGIASRDIKLGSLSLGSRAVFRAGSMLDTASSMKDLAARVNLTADSALEANQLAASAGEAADAGGSVVDRLLAALDSGKRSAHRVVEIVDGLDALAAQANTLALNAGLDAARAGPDAAGMAAVTSEVRHLARRVTASAGEIRLLATQSVAEIDGGTAWAAQAGTSMQQIASSVRQVEDIVSRIGSASQGQESSLEDVNQAIVRMDQVTRQNTSLVEEAAMAARTLQMQALALSRTMSGFRLEEPQAEPPEQAAAQKEDGDVPREFARERRRHPSSHLRLASSRK